MDQHAGVLKEANYCGGGFRYGTTNVLRTADGWVMASDIDGIHNADGNTEKRAVMQRSPSLIICRFAQGCDVRPRATIQGFEQEAR